MQLPQSAWVATKGILTNNRLLSEALALDVVLYHDKAHNDKDAPQAVLAWGRRPSYQKALALAHKLNLPLLTIEDGFLRSLDSGIQSRFGASFVMDDLGIYFDLTSPNRLQWLIAQTIHQWSQDKDERARRLIGELTKHQLSKYNSTNHTPNLSNSKNPHILVIDQVANDASIGGAGATSQSFYRMLSCAMSRYPDATIYIKAHPAGVGTLVDNGCLSLEAMTYLYEYHSHQDITNLVILSEPANPIPLLKQVDAVYTISSHMGFEALLLGKVVYCFGVNWYAGFGLTDDSALIESQLYQTVKHHYQQLGIVSVDTTQLFYAAYVMYSRYANPTTLQACDIETLIEYLLLNRTWQDKLAGNLLLYEFSRWKLSFVRAFVGFKSTHLTVKNKTSMRLLFSERLYQARVKKDNHRILMPLINKSQQHYLVWGLNSKRHLQHTLSVLYGYDTSKIFCMEDGFIRSNGLGASLLAPLSVVVDDVGIYYDATAPSRLEQILTDIQLTPIQNARAERLQALLLQKRVSKYNVGKMDTDFLQQVAQLTTQKPQAKIRLVVGQVEDDASVQNCASHIRTNSDLLHRVRCDFANDIIIYKPHPDVEVGLRVGKVASDILQQADIVAHDVAMPDCLQACQVVHTISSLTGFEALIRGREVVCYGVPFYAGFGLTTDVVEADNFIKQHALARRVRTAPLSLQALIFGVLVVYPLYRLPNGHGLTTPEEVIHYLYQQQESTPPIKQRAIHRLKTTAMQLYKNIKQR